jgi:hypothetical protein
LVIDDRRASTALRDGFRATGRTLGRAHIDLTPSPLLPCQQVPAGFGTGYGCGRAVGGFSLAMIALSVRYSLVGNSTGKSAGAAQFKTLWHEAGGAVKAPPQINAIADEPAVIDVLTIAVNSGLIGCGLVILGRGDGVEPGPGLHRGLN